MIENLDNKRGRRFRTNQSEATLDYLVQKVVKSQPHSALQEIIFVISLDVPLNNRKTNIFALCKRKLV